jgi:plasmid stability protein
MEQREILSQALIPHKEGNKMLYSLLAEQFISLQVNYRRVPTIIVLIQCAENHFSS